jgi:competence protein ComFC
MFFYHHDVPIDLTNPTLNQLTPCTQYAETGSDFIKKYKFGCSYSLAPTIGEIMYEQMARPDADLLVPVPLHKSRQRERGFNQAELIAKHLSKRWNIPILNALSKTKATTPQAELDRKKRLTHLRNSYVYISKVSLEQKRIALIDDVATTGTTLNECAKVLKINHAKSVVGIVFAHGSIESNIQLIQARKFIKDELQSS